MSEPMEPTQWPKYKALREDALAHPWAWCSRDDLPGTRVRYQPLTRMLETELTGVHDAITGERVLVEPGVVITEHL